MLRRVELILSSTIEGISTVDFQQLVTEIQAAYNAHMDYTHKILHQEYKESPLPRKY